MRLNINKQRSLWWGVSLIVILAGLVAMGISWQKYGAPLRPSLDFIGGTRLQLQRDCSKPENCAKPIDINAVRQVMSERGLGNSSIQLVSDERGQQQGISIRTKTLNVDERTQLQQTLTKEIGAFDPKATQIDTVGPTIGQQLLSSGLIALLVSFAGIVVYLSLRFQLDYAIFAIVALFHDVLITTGIFGILGLVQGTEVDSLFIVALLTITGFSVNDTVVIYDRIRETLKVNPDLPIDQVVDNAVNQTLGRSINTTLTVLLTLLTLFIFGGETLKNFALALMIGFAAGAYSSIFIASTLLSLWRERTGQSQNNNQLSTTSDQ
ncbi:MULTISPECIES: protein translocase subunit SecF [Chroococcidiopsis]|jgi:preprotein translocase subunit SecF|uniref:Protein-export membrane protein SecF n=1 Tax=Chroococcidiopsis thermalis (strain PCC 7203) TaxID=251229 RepID=K9TXS9_CHRTP|nr:MULTISPECIES: protein translocase subunit SecF [Chroococcidiopsis]AFY86991.1 protein translocase subunit secF [Chroococcidiopsis thermalis PCC 7203]PSB42017.1 protein translocase subunit SecF [Cyanosarcina cf. burmensis CCALA 770]URD51853.1 protein translocase subunit SecF [Chroococcidiopsis sp. CCNUC1]